MPWTSAGIVKNAYLLCQANDLEVWLHFRLRSGRERPLLRGVSENTNQTMAKGHRAPRLHSDVRNWSFAARIRILELLLTPPAPPPSRWPRPIGNYSRPASR